MLHQLWQQDPGPKSLCSPRSPPCFSPQPCSQGSPEAGAPLLPPLTVVVAAKRLVLGGVGVEVAELPQVPDAVAKGSDGQVLGGEGLDVLHLAGACG